MTPQKGETWVKKSFPTPTVVEIVNCDGRCVSVRFGIRKPIVVSLSAFLGQGFTKIG